MRTDGRFVDDLARALARRASRRAALARLAAGAIGGLLAARAAPRTAAGGRKAVGQRCARHGQCASGLCEATSRTCVAQCATPGEACGDGCLCQPIGTGAAGNACLQVPDDLNCSGAPACTWDSEAADPADQLSCPSLPGRVCTATGICSGPEEVCLPLCPPNLLARAG
jgi:hypothetical protein